MADASIFSQPIIVIYFFLVTTVINLGVLPNYEYILAWRDIANDYSAAAT